ncbi:hypothetical protein NHH03_13570 [Stieleria sp. TO1_6]|uniref:hypothetical protein n=1 Tax=Stieleria tagensis TaxID=2956795 RepID=UPI00209A92DF|nr:hypothetical protein [Stieleria tagensis]MCO8122771.1 hypothetical protein [Stieleria tagensis]
MKMPPIAATLPLLIVSTLLCTAGCLPPAMFKNEYVRQSSLAESKAPLPTGLRRTKNGWEDTTLWYVSPDVETRSINSWMDQQRQREPSWVRLFFDKLRRTPPLMIAVIQISAIAAIVRISRQDSEDSAPANAPAHASSEL